MQTSRHRYPGHQKLSRNLKQIIYSLIQDGDNNSKHFTPSKNAQSHMCDLYVPTHIFFLQIKTEEGSAASSHSSVNTANSPPLPVMVR